MNKATTLARAGLVAVSFACLTVAGAEPPVRITVTGSSTVAPLMADVAKAYDAQTRRTRTDVQSGGSSRGINDVRKGTAEIGMVSRAMTAEEKDLQSVLIARDGIAMVVHKDNSVGKLTRAQVIDIYTGKIRNWREVGGADLPITVVSKAEGRSTLEVFSAYFGLTYRAIKAHAIVGDNQQEIITLSGSKGSIGYVSIGSGEFEQKNGSPIKLVALDNHVPSSANVAAGAYPLSRELNLVYRAPVSKEVKALIDFMSTPAARRLVAEHFFTPAVHTNP